MNSEVEFVFMAMDPDPNLSPEDRITVANHIHRLVTEGAEKLVEPADAIGLSPAYIDALHELAVRHYRNRQFESAVMLYQRLVQLKPMQLAYYKGVGACCLGLQRYDAAIRAYSAAAAFGALDAELHFYLGQAHYFNKDYPSAFDLMRFARVLDEEDAKSPGRIAAFAIQMLERMKPLVPPEQAALIDLRPSGHRAGR